MALRIEDLIAKVDTNKTWFHDRKQLPGWIVSWRMARTDAGRLAVSELRIERAPRVELLDGWGSADDKVRKAAINEVFDRRVPGAGLTTALLRQVRLGSPRRRGIQAIKMNRIDGRMAPTTRRRSVGAPPTYTTAFWRKLAADYLAVVGAGHADAPKRLAATYRKKRSTMRSLIRRCADKGFLRTGYAAPSTAVQGRSATGRAKSVMW